MKVLHAVGARPNFMKAAPLMQEMGKYPREFEQLLVHTGQHYDENMSQVFFQELELPRPEVHLGVGAGSHAQQTALVMSTFEPVLLEYKPDWVFVVGDVNSTLACALTAAKLGTGVVHVEAGLRSFDRTMPEEFNRTLTDHLADLLFTPSRDADENLIREGTSKERIHLVGNVMIDTLVRLLPRALERWDESRLTRWGLEASEQYLLVTLHRPSNVDDLETLRELLSTLSTVAREMPVLFPVHPRTRRRIKEFGLDYLLSGSPCLNLTEPLGYLDFLGLECNAALVVTDSGGIQEETTYLGVPCLTVRPNTERPITIAQGTNQLVPSIQGKLLHAIEETLARAQEVRHSCQPPELWDGHAAERAVAVMRSVGTMTRRISSSVQPQASATLRGHGDR